MQRPIIEVTNLAKNYGSRPAIDNLSFAINPGEIFGLLGPNGAGKTTTIKVLTGQLHPSQGRVKVLGGDILQHKDQILPLVGFVPEATNLYERLTVYQNLQLFCRLYRCSVAMIDDYLKHVGMVEAKHVAVKTLSKGMKQRVLLIRALLHKPQLLFLDEPTAGLDPNSAQIIHTLLADLNKQGMTIVLTSHNMEEVEKLCQRVAFLHKGCLEQIGEPTALKLKYRANQVRVLIKAGESVSEKIISLNGEEGGRQLADWMRQDIVRSIHSLEPSLADVFVKVTGGEFD